MDRILVLDTNTHVGTATISQGPYGPIEQARMAGKFTQAVSEPILTEYHNVLMRPAMRQVHKMSEADVKQYIDNLRDGSVVTPGKEKMNVVKDDPADNKFLTCAIEANANAIVSNDGHLLDLRIFRNIPIITAEHCVDLLNVVK